MTADNFDQTLVALRDRKPFQFFTVELSGGQRFEVDLPTALVVRDGAAVFVQRGGAPFLFDHDEVNQIIAEPPRNRRRT